MQNTNEYYWQAEILKKNEMTLSSLTVNDKGCICTLGDGIRFSSKEECKEWIAKSSTPQFFKATEHLDI